MNTTFLLLMIDQMIKDCLKSHLSKSEIYFEVNEYIKQLFDDKKITADQALSAKDECSQILF